MIVPVLTAGQFFVKSGVRSHINFTAKDGANAFRLTGPVKVDDTVHNTVVRDGRAVHAQFFNTLYIFFYLVGTVQQTVFRMDMKMCKCHDNLPVVPYFAPSKLQNPSASQTSHFVLFDFVVTSSGKNKYFASLVPYFAPMMYIIPFFISKRII